MQKLGSSLDYGQEAMEMLAAQGLPDLSAALPAAGDAVPPAAVPRREAVRPVAGGDAQSLLPPPALKAVYDRVAAQEGVPVNILVAMGHTESRHRPDIDGPPTRYGAAGGIMQYLPGTAAAHKINRYNAEEAIRQAAKDLRERLAENRGDMANAVARHHAGDNPAQLGPKSREYSAGILAKAGKLADVYEAEQRARLQGASQAREAAREQAAESKRAEYYPPAGSTAAGNAPLAAMAGQGLFGFGDQLQAARQAAPYGDLGVMNGFRPADTPAAASRGTTPVTPDAEAQVRAALTVLPAGQREALLQDQGWRGQVARRLWSASEGAKQRQRATGIGTRFGAATPIVTRDEIEASYVQSLYTPEQAAQLAQHDLAGHTEQVRVSDVDFEGVQAARDNLLLQAGRDVQRGGSNLIATSEGLAGTVYGLLGQDDAARSALEAATARLEKTARENPALVGSYEHIHGADDAVRYAVEAVAENLPMFLPAMASGGVGGVVARKAAQGIVGDMVATVGRDRALQALQRHILLGQLTGAATASVGMETGSVAGDIYQKTGRAEPWLALAAGVPAGLLDTVEPVMALRKVAGPLADGVAGSLVRRLGIESGKQFMAEAGTEGLQTIIENAASLAAQNRQPFTPALLDGVVDAMLKGGIAGGVTGAGAEAVASLRPGSRQPEQDVEAATRAAFGKPPAAATVPGGPVGRAVGKAPAAAVAADMATDTALERPPLDEPMYLSAAQAAPAATATGQVPVTPAWGHPAAATLAPPPLVLGRQENFAADYPVPPAPDADAIAEVDARVAGARAQASSAQRRQLLDMVLADDRVQHPAERFAAELARAGYADTTPTATELAAIARFADARQASATVDSALPVPAAPEQPGDEAAQDWRAQRDADIQQADPAAPAAVTEVASPAVATPSAPSLTPAQVAIAEQSRAASQFVKRLRQAGMPVPDPRQMASLWQAYKSQAAIVAASDARAASAPPVGGGVAAAPAQDPVTAAPVTLPAAGPASRPRPAKTWQQQAAQVDVGRDSLRDAVARLGGIRKDEAMREWGATLVEGSKSRIFGKPVFRAKGGAGLSLDTMREALAELGYLPADSDINDLYQAFEQDSLHHVGQERRAALLAQQAAEAQATHGEAAAPAAAERTLDNHPVYDPWYDFDAGTILPDELHEAAAEAGAGLAPQEQAEHELLTTELHRLLGPDEAESLLERAAIMADAGRNYFEAIGELIHARQHEQAAGGAEAGGGTARHATGPADAGLAPDVPPAVAGQASGQPDARPDIDAGQRAGSDAGFALQSYDQATLDAADQAQEADAARRQADTLAADRRRDAEAEAGHFVLTGSERQADQLAARGQGGLFDAPSKAPNIDQSAPHISGDDSTAADDVVAAKAEQPDFPIKEIADSYRHISHHGSDSAKAEEIAFRQSIGQLRSEVGPSVETGAQQAAFAKAMADYQHGYHDAALKLARAREGTMSTLVAGRHHFNGKQAARTGTAYDQAQQEFARQVARLKAAVEQAVHDARTPEQIQAAQDKAAEQERQQSLLAFARAAGAIADDLRHGRQAVAGDTRRWANKTMMTLLDGMDEATRRQAVAAADKSLQALGGLAVVVGPRSTLGRRVATMLAARTSEPQTAPPGVPVPESDNAPPPLPQGNTSPPPEVVPAGVEAALTIDAFDAFVARLRSGQVTLAEFKARFADFKRDQQRLQDELGGMSKQALLQRMGAPFAARYKSEKKDRVVAAALSAMLDEFVLGSSYSYTMGGRLAAIEATVGRYTQTDLDGYAARIASQQVARATAMAQLKAGLDNPQTLEDFRHVMRSKMAAGSTQREAFLSLTPAQREQYDALAADASRAEREARQRQGKAAVVAAREQTGAKVHETKHTRDGYDLFVVQLDERVDRDSYNTLNANAKRMGGWYSKYRGNGAIPGFQFKDRASADAFAKLVQGDSSAAAAAVSARRDAFEDNKSQSAAERLRTMADRLDELADASLGRERKANTARRANFAAAAEAQAFAHKAQATTMRRLAEAIENGSSKFLGLVRQKVQIETLDAFLSQAKWDYLQAEFGNNWHAKKEERADKALADYASFPSYTAWASDLATLARQLLQLDGGKRLGERLQSVADDVTEEYLRFVKDNLRKVSTFSRMDGSGAVFSSKQAAEVAIRRSGLKHKAIAYSPKRGQHIIVMSPKAATEAGLFQSQNKRITLSAEFGAELLEKMREHPQALYPLHSLQIADERRKRLAGMGILTPMELRAALREYMDLREPPRAADKVKEMERAMVGRKADGLDFFPTPADTAQRMVELAGLTPEMRVLEPSAGMGHIAEKIRDAGIAPDVVEYASDRRDLLEAKGFNVVGHDFMALPDAAAYDRILMNPPFSQRRDAEHVQHAYSLLKPGGRLVAIMGEGVFFGQDKKAQAFRDWLDEVGGTSEQLEEGTFLDSSLPVNTGVNARLVVIDKGASGVVPDGARVSIADAKAAPVIDQLDAARGEPAATAQAAPTTDEGSVDAGVSRNARTKTHGGGVSVEDAGAIVGRILTNVDARSNDRVRIVPSVAMLPPQVRQWLDHEVDEQDHDIPAVYWNGNTFIIAENLHDAAHLEEALLHELMGHYGVRVLFGAETDTKLRQLFEDIGGWKGYLDIAEALGLTQRLMPYYLDFKDSPRLKFVMMDELLGHMAGLGKWPQSQLHTLIGKLKDYLRQIGFMQLPQYTISDLAHILAQARSQVIAGDDRTNPVENSQRASLGAASMPALTVADVQDVFRQSPLGSWVDRLVASGRLTIKPRLVLPEGYKHLEAIQAFTVGGKITLFAGNIGGRQRVMPVLLHEVFHSSGEALLGSKAWGKLIAELDQLRQHAEANPAGKAGKLWGDAKRRVQEAIDNGDNMSQADMAEELGAYAIELAAQAPLTWQRWFDRLLGHVKAWARRVFGVQLGRLTPEALRSMAVAALKAGKEATSASQKASVQLGKPLFGQREGLFDLPPIEAVPLSGEELGAGLSKKELAQAADALLREIQHSGVPLHNNDTGWDLVIGKKNRKKLGDNPDLTANDHKVITRLAELVSRAVLGEIHPDIKHGNENVQAVHRLYVPVQIGGNLLRVKLTVKDYLLTDGTGRKNLHAIETVEMENAPMGTVTTTRSKNEEWRSQPASGRKRNIAQNPAGASMGEMENAPMGTVTTTRSKNEEWRSQPASGRLVSIEALMAGAKRDSDGQPFVRFSTRGQDPVRMREGNFPGADSRDASLAIGRDAQRRLSEANPAWAQRLRDIGLKGLRPTLSMLPGNAVVDLYRDQLPALAQAQRHGEHLDGMRQTLQKEADETFREWGKLPADAADKMADLMHEATIWQLHPDQPAPERLSRKWAAKHAGLAADWAALPAEAQAVYRQVRDLYAKRTGQLFDALADRIDRIHGLGTASRGRMLADLRQRFDKTLGEGPYFPLSRFGDYLVVAKRLDGDGNTLEKVVLAAETEHEQRLLQQDLMARGFDVVELDKAAKNFRASSLGTDLSGFAAGLIDKLEGVEMHDDQRADILDDINQMLIDALPPASARKHFKHRKGVPGFSNDAVRAFVRSQASMASHIANLTYQDRIDQSLQAARKQARQDQVNVNELGAVVDEMEERAELARRFVAHPIANALTQLGFANFLGFSLSQGLLNLTQVPLLTYPALAARFGEAKTHAALRAAYAKVGRALTRKGGETWGDVRTLDDLDDDSRHILLAMEARGKLDLTMALDLVRGGAGPQAPGRGRITRAAQWVGRYAGWFNHISEAANRQVTAMAGYKLALGHGMSRDQAVDYVAKLLDDSQFNYAFSNRPRLLMSNAGRVIGLMHTFAINAMYRIGRNLYHAIGSGNTKEGREARSIMLRLLTVQTALAGLSSLPLLPLAGAAAGTAVHKATGSRVLGAVGVVAGVGLAQALVSGMAADDDEPWDFDAERRRILNDMTGSRSIAELLDKGLLRALGMDVANRISMNDLLMRDVDTGFSGKPAQTWLDSAFLQGIGGAAYGAVRQYARATDLAMDGQYHRAVEAALPKFASDMLKASRYAREEVRVPVGAVTAHKADASPMDVVRQALGFTPSTVAEINDRERASRQAVAQLAGRRHDLLAAWLVSRMEGDTRAELAAVAKIARFNRTQRQAGRTELVITAAERRARLRRQQKRVVRREQGLQPGRRYQAAADEAGEMYGE